MLIVALRDFRKGALEITQTSISKESEHQL